MTRWVEEHAKCGTWLVLRLGRPERQHRLLSSVEVVDHDVQVHLLRNVLAGPLRPSVLVDPLEADALVTCCVADLGPPVVGCHVPIEQCAVELGEATRIVAIEDE